MTRHAAVVKLRPDQEENYKQLHSAVWPGVLAMLKRAHVTNFSIFLRDGLLFSYLEYKGEDFEADMERIAADEITQKWWRLTAPCQEPLPTAADGQWWAPAQEVFHAP